MLEKRLKYYRLKKNLTKVELANIIGVTPMAISNYESGKRNPNFEVIKKLAKALDATPTDFLSPSFEKLTFSHNEFRKNSKMSTASQEFVRESVEEYFGRFFMIVEILGEDVIPNSIEVHTLRVLDNVEENAKNLRELLGLNKSGPISNLTTILESRGILIFMLDVDNDYFSGMNGMVNQNPYILINKNMTPARIRSTIAHELAHIAFDWSDIADEKEREKIATAISGAFLFPYDDAILKLGVKRKAITYDLRKVCAEYGISMYLLTKRASVCRIINADAERGFYIWANKQGWKKKEPNWSKIIEEETYFEQLVFRAVEEETISVQKAAELLKQSNDYIIKECFPEGV